MTQTTLKTGTKYDITSLTFTGWTAGDGTSTDGYNAFDYFADGVYLGPDGHGIEPLVDRPSETYKAIVWESQHNMGETTIPANQDLSDALKQACEWAADGDWPIPGEVDVRLYAAGDDEIAVASRTISVGA